MIRHICVAVFLAIAGLTRPGPTSVKRILMPESSNFKAVLIPAADAGHMRAQNLAGAVAAMQTRDSVPPLNLGPGHMTCGH